MVTRLPWQPQWYVNNSFVLSHIPKYESSFGQWASSTYLVAIVTRLPWQPQWYINNCLKLALYLLQSFMGQQVAMVIEISLWLPWGPSYHSNKICGTCLLFQETLVPNISSMWLKTNKLLMFQSGCHGNWVTIAMTYAADAFISKNLHSKYKLNITWKGIMETSLWLLRQQSYYSNEVCGWRLLSQGISLPNMNSIGL